MSASSTGWTRRSATATPAGGRSVRARRPELGLSIWQLGRLFGRVGVLVGDDIYSIRLRYWTDADTMSPGE